MSKHTCNAIVQIFPINCLKCWILQILHQTLGIIGIIWIFLVGHRWISLPKKLDTQGSSSDIRDDWIYLDFLGSSSIDCTFK